MNRSHQLAIHMYLFYSIDFPKYQEQPFPAMCESTFRHSTLANSTFWKTLDFAFIWAVLVIGVDAQDHKNGS